MKAVIVDIQGNRAAALLEDGRFVSVANRDYQIGQEVRLVQRGEKQVPVRRTFRQRAAAIAAAAALVLSAGGGGLAYAMPYGTVSIDVNPSIEYTINRFDRVLSVTGVNEEGQAVLEEIDSRRLVHKKVRDAISSTLDQLQADGYLNGEDDALVFSAGTGNRSHSASLAAALEETFSPVAEVYSVAVTQEEIQQAHGKGSTAGKMHLIAEIGRNEASPAEEEQIDRPVNDLMREFHVRRGDRSADREEEFRTSGEPFDNDFNRQEDMREHPEDMERSEPSGEADHFEQEREGPDRTEQPEQPYEAAEPVPPKDGKEPVLPDRAERGDLPNVGERTGLPDRGDRAGLPDQDDRTDLPGHDGLRQRE